MGYQYNKFNWHCHFRRWVLLLFQCKSENIPSCDFPLTEIATSRTIVRPDYPIIPARIKSSTLTRLEFLSVQCFDSRNDVPTECIVGRYNQVKRRPQWICGNVHSLD